MGVVLITMGAAMVFRSLLFFKRGEKVMAEVIELHVQKDSDGDETYAPVFKYMTKNNAVVEHQYWLHTTTPTWKVGEKVPLIYNKQDVKNIRVVTYMGLFRWAVIWISLGAICIVVGFGNVLFEKTFLN